MSTNYLRPQQIEDYEREKAIHQNLIQRPDPKGELNKGESVQAIQRIEKTLEQAPPVLNADQRDKANKLVKELEKEIQDGMLSHEEMRRCPPGAVDANRRWKRFNQQKIIDWKNAQLALNAGIDAIEASDLCHIDRLRPRTSNLNMDGAVIPQTRMFSFPSTLFKSRWDEIFATPNPEMEKVLRENERLRAAANGSGHGSKSQRA